MKREIERTLKGAECFIVASDKGVCINGNDFDVASLISFTISKLIEKGFPKMLLRSAVAYGFGFYKGKNKDIEDLMSEVFKTILEDDE